MAVSYNGWPASKNPADFGGITKLIVAGESFAPGVRSGDVHTVLEHVATQLHFRVEPVVAAGWHQADDWGYNYRTNRNANNLSCHSSGTAFDFNATRHPNGKRGTFSSAQVREIRKILTEVNNLVKWGGDFGTADEMHFEIAGTQAQIKALASRLRGVVSGGSRTLKRGTRGADVTALQRKLAKDYPSYAAILGRLVDDGDFGPQTEKWVREFQTRSKLSVDGEVGPATRKALGI